MKKYCLQSVMFSACFALGSFLLPCPAFSQGNQEDIQPSASPITQVEVVVDEPETKAEDSSAAESGAAAQDSTNAAEVKPAAEPVQAAVEEPVDDGRPRVASKYPDFGKGILARALLVDLEDGVLLSGDNLTITADMLAQKITEIPEEQRQAAAPFSIYILEDMAAEAILTKRVQGDGEAPKNDEELQNLMRAYFQKIVADIKAPEADAAKFFEENKGMFNGMAFEDVKEDIRAYLSQDTQKEAVEKHIRNLGGEVSLQVHAPWIDEQAKRVKDNPIDKAIAGGKAVLVDFYADWCGPCKMMKPTIEAMKEKFADQLTVVAINVDENFFLANRHQAQSIPLLLFYNKEGVQVSRVEGALEEEALKKELEKIGVK